MRKAMFLLAVFGLAGLLWAADPIIGTWKLNVAKSKFSPAYLALQKVAAPKEETLVFREVGDQVELTATGTRTDGSPISSKSTSPRQGGAVKSQQGGPEGVSTIVTVLDPGNRYTTSIRDGKQIQVGHSVISKDGKTMTVTYKGIDPQGKPFEQVVVLDKQ
jgi:hypothetical protein